MESSRMWARVNLAALEHNFRKIRELAPHSRIMPALKANAYGHGAVRVARRLPQADAFAVASLPEALELRAAGITQPVVLLAGFCDPAELAQIAEHQLNPVLHSQWQIDALRASQLAVDIWIKLDTGMGRLGFDPGRAESLARQIDGLRRVRLLGWMTHFARADEPGNGHTQEQIVRFERALDGLPGERSLANSAAILAWPEAQADWVRPGIMLYGASPFAGRSAQSLGLRPVMSLFARLLSVKMLPAGSGVGYGSTWVCPVDMPVGIVAAGYADGLPRALPAGLPVRLPGGWGRLIGRVSMDLMALDLRECEAPEALQEVGLWGDEHTVDAVAEQAGTIGYELLAAVGGRVARVYLG